MHEDFAELLSEIGLTEKANRSEFSIQHISRAEFSRAIAKILDQAGNLVINIEDRNGKEPSDYLELMQEMISLSDGVFTPEEVDVGWADDIQRSISIRYLFGSRSYRFDVPVYSFPSFSTDTPIRTVNRSLAELGIAERFHTVCVVDELARLKSVSIIFLSPTQREKLLLTKTLILPWADGEANVWTEAKIDEVLGELADLGLLSGHKDEEIRELKSLAMDEQINSVDALVHMIPNLVYNFDTEYMSRVNEEEVAYREIIHQLGELSKNEFVPKDLRIDIEQPPTEKPHSDKKINLSFEFNEREYSQSLMDLMGWIDVSFIGLFNRALAESGASNAYYLVETGDQTASIMFISAKTAERIDKSGMISLSRPMS